MCECVCVSVCLCVCVSNNSLIDSNKSLVDSNTAQTDSLTDSNNTLIERFPFRGESGPGRTDGPDGPGGNLPLNITATLHNTASNKQRYRKTGRQRDRLLTQILLIARVSPFFLFWHLSLYLSVCSLSLFFSLFLSLYLSLISSHFISSHPISSHLISSYLISSDLISTHLVSSYLISSHLSKGVDKLEKTLTIF